MVKDYRLLPAACFAWFCAVIAINFQEYTVSFIAISIVTSIIMLVVSGKKHNTFPMAVFTQITFCALIGLIIAVSFALQSRILFSDVLQNKVIDGVTVQVDAKVISNISTYSSFGDKMACQMTTEAYNLDNEPSRFFLKVSASDEICKAQYGGTYSFTGRLKEDTFSVKNAAKMTVSASDSAELISVAPPNWLDAFCNEIHTVFIEQSSKLPEHAQALVPGMAIGDTALMSDELSDAFKVAGLTHLIAVSGGHFVIFISLVGFVMYFLRMPKSATLAMQVVSIVMFTALVHPGDSVKRAAFMGLIGIAGNLFKRRSASLSALTFCIICFLIWDPWIAVSYGFAMSCAATASIIIASGPMQKWLEPFLGEGVAGLVSIPLVAQLACTPILLLMTPALTPYAVLANILVLPVIEISTISSVLAAWTCVILPPVSWLLSQVGSISTWWIAFVANTISSLPAAKIPWPGGSFGITLIGGLTFAALISPTVYKIGYEKVRGYAPTEANTIFIRVRNTFEHQLNTAKVSGKRFIRTQKVLAGLIIATIIIPSVVSVYGFTKLGWFSGIPTNWRVVACDVGQGDGTVIRTGENRAILIDAGPADSNITKCLDRLGINQIDIAFISHYHDDHLGGYEEVLRTKHVQQLVVTPVKSPAVQVSKVDSWVQKYNISQVDANATMQGKIGEKQWQINWEIFSVWDDAGINGAVANDVKQSSGSSKSAAEDDRENDSSLALYFKYIDLDISYVTMGDLEVKGQAAALNEAKQRDIHNVDIVKVSHHGSRTQNKELATLLNPVVALYCVGKNNYGHPNASTISMFESIGAKTLRTDTMGITGVSVNSESKKLEVFHTK